MPWKIYMFLDDTASVDPRNRTGAFNLGDVGEFTTEARRLGGGESCLRLPPGLASGVCAQFQLHVPPTHAEPGPQSGVISHGEPDLFS